MNFTRWTFRNENKVVANAIKEKYGTSDLVSRILSARGVDYDELENMFFCRTLESPFVLKDMDIAVKRLKEAVSCGEKIAIYGDYDCDGICAAAMLKNYLSSVGADVFAYVPERSQGYGLSCKIVDLIKNQEAKLIVTVDNGVVAFEEADYIEKCGMDLIVTDHHNIDGDCLPKAVAVVNPKRGDDCSKFKEICGAVVVFKLIAAMENGDYEFAFNFAGDLAAIATVGDVMPLIGENRLIVERGLKTLPYTENRGLFSLLKKLSFASGVISSKLVAFGICPRLNAPGRLGSAYVALKLLTCSDGKKSEEIADELCNYNFRRKRIEAEIFSKARDFILKNRDDFHNPVLVIYGDRWENGLVGLIAGKLMEIYCKPVVVLSVEGEVATGSARSFSGFSIFEALKYCSEYFIKWGGHELAGGVTMPAENLEIFKKRINEYAFEQIRSVGPFFRKKEIDLKIEPKDVDINVVKNLKKLEPFGNSNSQPVFLIENARLLEIVSLSDGKYVKLKFEVDSNCFNVICFNKSFSDFYYEVGDFLNVLVNIEINNFRDVEKVSYRAVDIRPSELNEQGMVCSLLKFERIIRHHEISDEVKKFALPSRLEFLHVYEILRKFEKFCGTAKDLYFLIFKSSINYCKLCLILEVFVCEKVIEINSGSIVCLKTSSKFKLSENSIIKSLIN